MKITILGSCRQYPIKTYYDTTSIQDRLTFPHYTKEIIQAIEYCKGINTFDNNLSKYCFRTGILENKVIDYQHELIKEFNATDIFVVEIASRICYEWNNTYVHHILTESQYGFYDISNIKQYDLTDAEVEKDLIKIKELVFPKKLLVVSHNCTRAQGKRYDLIKLLERLTAKYNIPFMNPSKLLNNRNDIYKEVDAFHYTPHGEELIGVEYNKTIENIINKKTVILVWKPSYNNYPRDINGYYWGIGDLIRGLAGIYKLSKKYNFDLILDKRFHPISQFLTNDKHIYSAFVNDNIKDVPLIMPDDVENYIVNKLLKTKEEKICIFSNMPANVFEGQLSEDLIDFIISQIQPNDALVAYIESYISKLGKYSVIHYRLGDDELVKNEMGKHNMSKVFMHLLKNIKPDSILLTDSTKLKTFVKSHNKFVKVLDTNICHLGFNDTPQSLKDTLLEFFILKNATSIKSFTTYGWPSGFTIPAHKIFKVPLESHTNVTF